MNEHQQELAAIMEAYPLLDANGYGEPTQEWREDLAGSVEEFAAAKQWIMDNLWQIQSINRRRDSYGMKHIAEKEIGYVTNGVFIAAMLACGYRMDPWLNPTFNVSERAVKRAWKKVHPWP